MWSGFSISEGSWIISKYVQRWFIHKNWLDNFWLNNTLHGKNCHVDSLRYLYEIIPLLDSLFSYILFLLSGQLPIMVRLNLGQLTVDSDWGKTTILLTCWLKYWTIDSWPTGGDFQNFQTFKIQKFWLLLFVQEILGIKMCLSCLKITLCIDSSHSFSILECRPGLNNSSQMF